MFFRKLRNLQYAAAYLSINIVFEYIFDEFGEKMNGMWLHLYIYLCIQTLQ